MTRFALFALTICLALNVHATEIIHSVMPLRTQAALPKGAQHLVQAGKYKSLDCVLQADRFEYWQDDLNGQFLAILPQLATNPVPARMRIVLHKIGSGDKQSTVAEAMTGQSLTNKFSFLVAMPSLAAGKYRATAALVDDDGKVIGSEAACDFDKVAKQNPVVTIPSDGIPIEIENQELVADSTWPVRAGVPLPINAVMNASRLALFGDGKPVPAQIKPIATWCPQGSVQWVHVDFLGTYSGGKPSEYRLQLLPKSATPLTTSLACSQTDDKITVDTGAIRFEVNRRKFTGIDKAWFDPAGAGKYDEKNPVVSGSAGPYIEDGRILRFDAASDTNAVVVVEEQGPVRVTIRAEGWYVNAEGSVDPLCKFVTRITAYAGQPMLRVSHHTILTCDTQKTRLKDVGFQIASSLGESFQVGADGAIKTGVLPVNPKTIFLHQNRFDHFRLVGPGTNTVEGTKSDGWFSIGLSTTSPSPLSSPPEGRGDKESRLSETTSDIPSPLGGEGRVRGAVLTLVLRDIWQKYPKEVEMSREGLTVHFWPKHGHRAFALKDELDEKNIYKFWCFHQGDMLNLYLPDDYYGAFAGPYKGATTECLPEHALNGNGQGLAIGNEFELLFTAADQAKDVPKHAQLFQRDPAAHASTEWNASTGALGKMDAADRKHFPIIEEAVEKGWLSWTHSVERGNDYGMWIWPDTHTYWDAKEDCAELHRVWHNSHYHEVGQTWLMYYRSGSPDLLRWARANTDRWINIGTVNYADFNAKNRPTFKYHYPGAMYHCKALTPWGARDYGMNRNDTDAGLWGHWVDPDALLWDWYLTGNERAKDVYDLWSDSVRRFGAPIDGTKREANTSLAYALTYYQATWDAEILPNIRGMGLSLRTGGPLENQNPGPLWHPLWINRYYEQTRDPEYAPFILKYARMIHLGDTWTTGLASLAYDLSGDKTYLTQHFEQLADYPKLFFHKTGDPYDWFGVGPGALGDQWGGYFCWGNFLQALHKAGITNTVPEKSTHCGYLVGGQPSLTVLALEPKDQPFQLTFRARSLGADMHRCKGTFVSPGGKVLAKFEGPESGGSTLKVNKEIPADGERGIYRLELNAYEASVAAPVTDLPTEAMLLTKNAPMNTLGVVGYLRPSDETQPVEITIASGGGASSRNACNVVISDADGKVLATASLFKPRNTPPVTLTLDPKQHKLPWKLDVFGPATIQWKGRSDKLLFGQSDEALKAIISALEKK